MKKTVFVLSLLFLLGCVQEQKLEFSEEVFFCPEDNCAGKLVARFSSAQQSIDVAVYSFTLDEIADALITAKNRGVKVRVIMDAVQAANQYSEDERLLEEGIRVKIAEKQGGSMHNKFAVIDGKLVATGSFNYSANANERNDENLVFLFGTETAAKFSQEFEEIWSAS